MAQTSNESKFSRIFVLTCSQRLDSYYLLKDLEKLLQSNPPLRLRRQRTNFNETAIQILDQHFSQNPYPDINEREAIAHELNTSEDRVQVWFQNKRARYRKKIQKENIKVEKIPILNSDTNALETSDKMSTPINSRVKEFSFEEQLNISNSINDSAYASHQNSPNYSFQTSTPCSPYPFNYMHYMSTNYAVDSSYNYDSTSFRLRNQSFIQQLSKRVPKTIFRPFE